jgi:drug/metabolite transporter (DMT)-like permease
VPDGAVSAVVALGLGAAIAWGTADFGGGLSSRRSPVYGVVLAAGLIGAIAALALALLRAEPLPGPTDVGWSVLSGVAGAVAMVALYAGLATGRMGVVAPVTGVLAATVPVVAGIGLEGLPGAAQLGGIGLAIIAVLLVSRSANDDAGGRPSGLGYGVVAGIGLGLLGVMISRVTDGLVFGPLTILRVVQVTCVATVVVLARRPWRLAAGAMPAVGAVGLTDMAGNGLFLAAAQVGPLAVAAVLSSLYPVTTLVLATAVLRERLGGRHVVGIACAILAIVLIGAGSPAG